MTWLGLGFAVQWFKDVGVKGLGLRAKGFRDLELRVCSLEVWGQGGLKFRV